MIATILKLIAGPVAAKVLDVLAAHDIQTTDRAELRAQIERAVIDLNAQIVREQAGIVAAELKSESWLQRNWRPCVAVGFSSIIIFYGLAVPVAVDWFDAPPVRIGDALLQWIMQAVLICLGGYIGGRSIEKIARALKG